ncbi:probable inactive purple acid phosphatase 28 isoform X8 [Amborella trichopoda]|uniref:probable inactive purple acid phosphatase 28 isoform X8 n=1 Tax=Amborella trichopoda TaxID=13333 RepID=UPI0005D429B8|nr:probable inactive purple acid phosphatase 28 isoform X8 [Amborella trichopoda]|eukprot:XP_011623891.1 probable inactive purple acid phosphatase 28 isoform X8 [Amborella trichopoda]
MCRNKLRKCDPRPILHLLIYLLFIYATLLVIHTIFGRLFIGNHAVKIKRSATLPLRFNSQGTFKILQVADMHFANGVMSRCRDVLPFEFHYCTDLNTSDFFRRIVREERPDFIAFTVSQVNPVTYGYSDGEKKVREIDGFGNYNIEVSGAIGSELANMSILNLYFLDSGDRSTVPGIRGYGWIRETQQIWLRQISEMIKDKQRAGPAPDTHRPPSLAFFHIPIPEVRQLWFTKFVGQFQEGVACPTYNSGVLNTLINMGDVKAVFLGHDHTNDFCGELNGIWFCYGGGFGYHGYGKAGWHRRVRVILAELERGERNWKGVHRIKTWKRLDDGSLSKIDELVLWTNPLST